MARSQMVILAILGHFGPKIAHYPYTGLRRVSREMAHFGPFWAKMAILGHFGVISGTPKMAIIPTLRLGGGPRDGPKVAKMTLFWVIFGVHFWAIFGVHFRPNDPIGNKECPSNEIKPFLGLFLGPFLGQK